MKEQIGKKIRSAMGGGGRQCGKRGGSLGWVGRVWGVPGRRPAGGEGQATARGRAGQVSAESLPPGAQPV